MHRIKMSSANLFIYLFLIWAVVIKKIGHLNSFWNITKQIPKLSEKRQKRTKQLLFQNTISYRFHSSIFSSTMQNRFKIQHEIKCEI